MARSAITLLVIEKAIGQALGANPPNRPAKHITLALADQVDRLQDRGTDLDELIRVAVESKVQARPVEPYIKTLRQLFATLKQGERGKSRYDRVCAKRNRPSFHASTA